MSEQQDSSEGTAVANACKTEPVCEDADGSCTETQAESGSPHLSAREMGSHQDFSAPPKIKFTTMCPRLDATFDDLWESYGFVNPSCSPHNTNDDASYRLVVDSGFKTIRSNDSTEQDGQASRSHLGFSVLSSMSIELAQEIHLVDAHSDGLHGSRITSYAADKISATLGGDRFTFYRELHDSAFFQLAVSGLIGMAVPSLTQLVNW